MEKIPDPVSPAMQTVATADISLTAHGDRRALESLYLELRALAKQNGLTLEYRLSVTEPDQADSCQADS